MCEMSPAQSRLFRAILRVDVSRLKRKADMIEAVDKETPRLQWHTPQTRKIGQSQLSDSKDDPSFDCLFPHPQSMISSNPASLHKSSMSAISIGSLSASNLSI